MIASLPSAFAAFFLEVVLMGVCTVLGVVRSAARILGGITAHRKGMPRRVVALPRAGGDVTNSWHWRALHTLGVVCIEDMQSCTKASKWPFLLFLPFVTIKEEREGEPQVVSFLSRVFPVSVTIVISSLDFFL